MFLKEDRFKITQFIREMIFAVEKELDNFPKKNIEIKNRISIEIFDILEIAYCANTEVSLESKKSMICKIIGKAKMIDFLINLSYEKQLVSQKKYLKLANRLEDIVKYSNGWLASLV